MNEYAVNFKNRQFTTSVSQSASLRVYSPVTSVKCWCAATSPQTWWFSTSRPQTLCLRLSVNMINMNNYLWTWSTWTIICEHDEIACFYCKVLFTLHEYLARCFWPKIPTDIILHCILKERSHVTKFSPSPIFSLLLFSIVSINNEQNGWQTHSAHYSARHHWHNAKLNNGLFFKVKISGWISLSVNAPLISVRLMG